ncbi:MFS-type transporter SLC18B1-like isoform X1 [Dermacentor variabilis]|uniref:MFS-type transporter SLC18B1-like isoform X1 n=1 Tax=Dermacentor variabilis TaxID=34621 RepID=UPI003F5C3F7C
MPDGQGLGSSGQHTSYTPVVVGSDDRELVAISKDETTETDKLSQGVAGVDFTGTYSPVDKKKSILERHKWKICLLPMIHTQFWVAAAYSLLAPLFPALAVSSGLEAWEYGFVFSLGKITTLIGSAWAKRLIQQTSPKSVYLIGQVGYFLANAVYGALYWIPGDYMMLGVALFGGALGGLSESLYCVASYATATVVLADHLGFAVAGMQVLWGLGGATGATLGGAIADLWGYPASFFVMSSVFMLSSPFIATSRIFRRNRKPAAGDPHANGENTCGETNMKHYWLLRDARFISYLFNLFLNGLIFGFLEPTLEPYLNQFHHSSSGIGSVFSVYALTFCVASAVCGFICHCKAEIRCLPLAHLFNITGFIVIGPAPFLPFEPTMNLIYASQVLLGAGVASMHALSYSTAIKRAIAKGYKEDIDTSSFVCGAIFAAYVIGATLSPPISGYVVEALGFRAGSMIIFGMLVAWMIALLLLQKNSRSVH